MGGFQVAGGAVMLSGALLAQTATRRRPSRQGGDKEVTSLARQCYRYHK
ncbi:hypothetical protein GCM10010176_039050 [Nonomuraea spiralis]|nr:hypothetical protein GCM10010176_039050 [Nonomuraea spiralis]